MHLTYLLLSVVLLSATHSLDTDELVSEVNAQLPTGTEDSDFASAFDAIGTDISDILKSASDIMTDPALSLSIPNYSDFVKTVVPTDGVFTGPYPSDIAQSFSQFTSTRSAGQREGFSVPCKPVIVVGIRGSVVD